MKLLKNHPLFASYVVLQMLAFTLAFALGLAFVFIYVPHKKSELIIDELSKGCEILRRLQTDQALSTEQALEKFIAINKGFFVHATVLKNSVGTEPVCTPQKLANSPGFIQMRIDNSTVLETDVRPPTPAQLEMRAANETEYEIQHHHPVIWGMTPEGVSAMVLGIFLLAGFLSSFAGGLMIVKKATREAGEVIDRMKNGDLQARFPFGNNRLAQNFNEMASEIEKLVQLLRASEDVRVRILQELTHDLKTPVASLRLLLESLRDKSAEMSKEQMDDFFNTSIQETHYFSRLVQDLLFISGVNDPQFKKGTKRIDLAQLVAAELTVFATHDEIKSMFHCESDPAFVYGEELLLQRLVRNGIDNAFSFAEHEVEVRLSATPTHWWIDISEDGPGASEEDMALFGNKRSSRHLRTDQQRISLGLGSVIMRKIATSYGGDVALQRSQGRLKGATLRISLSR
ncbi:MAG: HAMP domain-containing histidine kinase [Bdellovibrionales bacterium]|nr:HAMP domain-containing histidine kinase [Bdellovibrionales bacterium]